MMYPLRRIMRKHWILLLVCLSVSFTATYGDCTDPPTLENAQLAEAFLSQTSFPVNTTVSYDCQPGYIRNPEFSNTITCLSNSTWSTPVTFCQKRSCGNPGEPVNGKFHVTDFLFGSRVNYTCNIGYNMQSKRDYRECLADGHWSNSVPECQVQECAPPDAIVDGTFTPDKQDYVYTDTVTYKCNNDTLSLIGAPSIFCTEHGNWSAASPECKAIDCSNPEVANGRKTSGFSGPYKLDHTVTFECVKGYKMTGSAIVRCNISNQWDPPLPECDEIVVTQKPTTIKESETEGSSATQKPTTTKDKESVSGGAGIGAMIGNRMVILVSFVMGLAIRSHF